MPREFRNGEDRREFISQSHSSSGRHAGAREQTFGEKQRSKILGTIALLLLWGLAITGTILGFIALTKNDSREECICNPDNTSENPFCCTQTTPGSGVPLVFQKTDGDENTFFVKRLLAGVGIEIFNVLESHLNISVLLKSLTPQLNISVDPVDNSYCVNLDRVIAAVTPGNCTLLIDCQLVYGNSSNSNVSFGRAVVDTHDIVDLTTNSITIPRNGIYRFDSNIYISENGTSNFTHGVLLSGVTVERSGIVNQNLLGNGAVYIGDGPHTGHNINTHFHSIAVSGMKRMLAGDIVRLTLQFNSQYSVMDTPFISIVGDGDPLEVGDQNDIFTEFMVTEL